MFSYIIAAALIVTAPVMAECNCSPEKIEALRAKLRAEGASEAKVKDVNCEDVCEAEKPLANSNEERDAKEGSAVACEDKDCSEAKEGSEVACEGTDVAVESEEGSSRTGSEIALETEESKSSTKEETVLAGCNCGSGKKGQGNGKVRA